MADERVINGEDEINVINGEDQTKNNFSDLDRKDSIKIVELTQKIEVLEQEKGELFSQNLQIQERFQMLTEENEELKNDKTETNQRLEEMTRQIEGSESDKKALEAISARARDLETDLWRCQDDIVLAESTIEEKDAEITKLKKMMEDSKLDEQRLETERTDMKDKIRALEERVGEGESEKIKMQQDYKVKFDAQEREISKLKKSIEELESVVAKIKAEKEEKEAENNELKDAVRILEEKVRCAESVLDQARSEGVKRNASVSDKGIVDDHTLDPEEPRRQWPMAVASTGAMAAAAVVCYLHYRKQR